MNVRKAILKRQSIRRFKNEDVKQSDLELILDAGRLAPSGDNRQNWHFVVIRDRALKEKIKETIRKKNQEIAIRAEEKNVSASAFRKKAEKFSYFFVSAPVLIVIYTKLYKLTGQNEYEFAGYPKEAIEELYLRNPGLQNIGAAVENMTLMAVELGLGSCWMTGQNYAAGEIAETIKKETGFEKDGYFMACMLALGVPEADQKSPAKKELSEIVTYI